MGNAYSSLAYAIPKHILGGREIADLRVSLEEEAAVYKFFGKRSSNATRISEQGKQIEPLLFDFYWLLSSKANFDRPLDQNLVTVLQDGFKRFKESLDHINPKELHETVTAMAVLQMYGITGVLYEGQVKIPTQVSKLPRSDFVELFGGDKVRAERVWEHILSPTNVVIHPD